MRVISWIWRLRLITPTSTLFIMNITKTSSNHCLLIRRYKTFHSPIGWMSFHNRTITKSLPGIRSIFILPIPDPFDPFKVIFSNIQEFLCRNKSLMRCCGQLLINKQNTFGNVFWKLSYVYFLFKPPGKLNVTF